MACVTRKNVSATILRCVRQEKFRSLELANEQAQSKLATSAYSDLRNLDPPTLSEKFTMPEKAAPSIPMYT